MQPVGSPLCPSCDRYIGPAASCPYCNTAANTPPLMRAMRGVAILLATVGLVLLYVASKHREPPRITISEITPVMNFAHVRVVGTVPRKAYISRDRTHVSFTITDETGSLRVVAYRNVAKALLETRAVPTVGDEVEVRGSLSISAKSNPKMYLKSPQHLTPRPKKP